LNAWSASIEYDEGEYQDHIIIQGDIEPGDYEKFIDAALAAGSDVYSVVIASRGGDALEAMKIGRLIRALKFQTEVPHNVPPSARFPKGGAFCKPDLPIAAANCTCSSSCVLLYLAGVYRFGDYLGVHRVFVDHDYLAKMSMDEAARYSRVVSGVVDAYLSDMGAPRSLLEKISSVASDDIEILDRSFIKEHLEGYAIGYEEWFIATCGSSTEPYYAMGETGDIQERKELMSELEDVLACERKKLASEKRRAFYRAVRDAFTKVDPTQLPRRSLLESLFSDPTFDMTMLIGLQSQNALDLLTLIGFGTLWESSEIQGLRGNGYKLEENFVIGFGTDGTVSSVDLEFYENEETGRAPYERHFLEGLDATAVPQDFVSRYGDPQHPGCYNTGVCFVVFTTKGADIRALFNEDDRSLRAISFNRPGYWDNIYED